MIRIKALFSIAFLVCHFQLVSQSSLVQDDIIEIRKQSVINSYNSFNIGTVLTGKKYVPPSRNEINNRYFKVDTMINGSLIYNGVSIKNIPTQYDLVNQRVVVLLKSNNNEDYISLDSDKITGFTLDGNEFIRLSSNDVMQQGFYQIAYKGENSILFAMRNIRQVKTIVAAEINIKLIPQSNFFIQNKLGVFAIKNKKDLLKAFNFSDDLKKILRVNKIRLSKKHFEENLTFILSIVDSKINSY